jgi:hypothetical protein
MSNEKLISHQAECEEVEKMNEWIEEQNRDETEEI